MIPVKTPALIKHYLGGYVWERPNAERKIYLTFDDGPVSEVTPWVLDILKKYKIQATFFCVGENVFTHPKIFKKIIEDGHGVGNHTYNHLKGWKTATGVYIENIQKSQFELEKHKVTTNLFRPPYGKLTPSQTKTILNLNYEIVMWTVLSKDYRQTLSPKKILDNIITYTSSGSIIVCHDNIKAFSNLKVILPQAIENLLEKGFEFCKL